MAAGVAHRRYPAGKRAKIIPLPDQTSFIEYVSSKRHGWRNAVMALLSFKAGLRACEIAGLDWTMALDANGRVADNISVSSIIAKKGSGRTIPCHPELRKALRRLHSERGKPLAGAICRSCPASAPMAQI